ncbi:MAG: hypothetical protein KDA33_12115 [Phycisphaerales bacterium]|nr:hypothetical protein [Phycisphaerales bacterium]
MLPQTVKTRGIHVGIRFAPQAPLDKQHRQAFQMKANEGFDWQRHEYAANAWRLSSPQPENDRRSELKFTIQPDAMAFEDQFPTGPIDLFQDNLKLAMGVVGDVFRPQLMIGGSGCLIRLTAQSATGDSRRFLGQHCMRMEDQLKPLGRPVFGVGFKLLLPAVQGEGQPHWQATMRVESLMEDPKQLFIEVDARWPNPTQWSADEAANRLRTAFDFSTNQVVSFLEQFGGPGGA